MMHLLQRNRERTADERGCRLCAGSGRVPYVDNHFDLWMVPCPSCRRS